MNDIFEQNYGFLVSVSQVSSFFFRLLKLSRTKFKTDPFKQTKAAQKDKPFQHTLSHY